MSRNRVKGLAGSRATRRAGTKALVCAECQRAARARPGVTTRTVMSFRGHTRTRLNRHLREVHGKKVP